MPDLTTTLDVVLTSAWLLPVLAVLVAVDGPLPMLPTETLLLSASTVAFGSHDVPILVGLFVAALVGSAAGDLLVFGLGRGSRRWWQRRDAACALTRWVHGHLLLRPGTALVGARFVPGGRLVSTAAAGRAGLSLARFVPWSVASSAMWSCYMLAIGLLIGPVTGGAPVASLVAGVAIGVLTAGGFALFQGVRRVQAGAVA
ncbi:MAG TPA: VTT domain-containing protein [Pseudonocardia sp.]|nr:VTT domain-containing protein [Pseudonocardia sp.]